VTRRAFLAGKLALTACVVKDQIGGTLTAFINQVGVDAPIPVSPIRVLEEVTNLGAQRVMASLGGVLWEAPPVAQTRR
jgi:hypothetical protein